MKIFIQVQSEFYVQSMTKLFFHRQPFLIAKDKCMDNVYIVYNKRSTFSQCLYLKSHYLP